MKGKRFFSGNQFIVLCRSEAGEVDVRYRKHSNIGTGKLKKLGQVSPSVFNASIMSDFSSAGRVMFT